ncbi:MAG: hypothetical protein HOW73_06505 [Polyangiaceae bacterium]|nr:hypothetical protein [Polyangiaceae bacterium]
MRGLPFLLLSCVVACGAREALEPDGDGGRDGSGGIVSNGAGGEGAGAIEGGGGSVATGGSGGAEPEMSIVEACTIAASCGVDAGWQPFTASSCIDGYARLGWHYDPPIALVDPSIAMNVLSCAQQPTCEAFRACYGGDWVSLGRCREGGFCLDDETIGAGFDDAPAFDCGSIGAACTDLFSDAQRACCNATTCGQPYTATCTGNVASLCGFWGEYAEFDCAVSGRTCQPDIEAPCRGSEPCNGGEEITCEGSVARYCSGGGWATFDCSTTGYRTECAEAKQSSAIPCRPASFDCDPTLDPDACDGDELIVCADGERVGVSCTSLGFSGCEIDVNGRAKCVE